MSSSGGHPSLSRCTTQERPPSPPPPPPPPPQGTREGRKDEGTKRWAKFQTVLYSGTLYDGGKWIHCPFVCFIARFKLRVTTFTWIDGMQMSRSEFASPGDLLDLGFCGPRLDASPWLGAPAVSWEMRPWTLSLQLGHFSHHHHGSLATSKSSIEWCSTLLLTFV